MMSMSYVRPMPKDVTNKAKARSTVQETGEGVAQKTNSSGR